MANKKSAVRNLVLVLGDQLDPESAAFDEFDRGHDLVWMAEVRGESTHVWSHKARIAIFLTSMRHFAAALKKKQFRIEYRELDASDNELSLRQELARAIRTHKPAKIILVEPGDYRVRSELQSTAVEAGVPLEIRTDRHFFSTIDDFRNFAKGRKQLRLEFFYRQLRQRTGILMDGEEPVGGAWNYDSENRGTFAKSGPGLVPAPRCFPPDAITTGVLKLVEREFAGHPGSLLKFDWPVTPCEAELALADFIEHRLPSFGEYQDAMWTAEPWLYHSRVSSAMNLKLLDPRKVVATAEAAYRAGAAPLAAVEGFIRQILGWREYIRGVYWTQMPGYLERNALGAEQPLPKFYWTADTDYHCLKQAIGQTLELGYAHHIQRLMVTGLFSLLLGVKPKEIHEWYLAVYVDAVEWVEAPNVLGMSQFADGGLMASKPYIASGKYIQRMSNYCRGCRYDPGESIGETACPFTTLYWDFLMRHETILAKNPRTVMQVRNLKRMDDDKKSAIRKQAQALRISLL